MAGIADYISYVSEGASSGVPGAAPVSVAPSAPPAQPATYEEYLQQEAAKIGLSPEQLNVLRNMQFTAQSTPQFREVSQDEFIWQQDPDTGNMYLAPPPGAQQRFHAESGDSGGGGAYYVMPTGNKDEYNYNSIDWEGLKSSGLQSKYNTFDALPNDLFMLSLQRPGMHKYDTFNAYYKRDPNTGQFLFLGGDPTRQISSGETFRDTLEEMGGVAAGMVLAGYGMTNPAMFGSGAIGAAGQGAAVGGGLAAAQGGGWDEVLRAAAMGGATAGIGEYASSGNIGTFGPSGSSTAGSLGGSSTVDDYMRYGASDGSVASGNGGYAGAIESAGGAQIPEAVYYADDMAGAVSYPVSSMPYEQTVSISAAPVASAVTPAVAAGGISGLASSPAAPASTPMPYEQTVEVRGQRDNPTLPSALPYVPGPSPDITTGSSTLPATPEILPNTPQMSAGPQNNSLPSWLRNNPRLAARLLLGLGGAAASSGGSGSGGIGLSGAQSDFTAQQPEAFRRQYVAPPAGYRPGFDPEHKFFTGIGTVGTGE
jgi:hypothetical protein